MRGFAWPLLLLAIGSGGPARAAAAVADTSDWDWAAVPEYRIVPGDLLTVNFGPSPESAGLDIVRNQRVRPDGRISLFPVGDVIAAGRTPRQLELALIGLYSAELRNPRITVEVQEVAGNQFHILGQVVSPGSYPAGPFLTLSQAIARAGGFKDDAARNSVLVFHRQGSGTVRVSRVRVDRGLKSGRLDADPLLSRFDIVFVPRSTIGNINVFTRQFFAEQGAILDFAFVGWELFNLDKVFVVRPPR